MTDLVRLVVVDTGQHPGYVRAITDLVEADPAKVAFLVRPNSTRPTWIAADLIRALGKRLGQVDALGPGADYLSMAAAWLAADVIREAVVFGAQDARVEELQVLISICVAGQVRLWLVTEHGLPEQTHRVAAGWTSDVSDFREITAALQATRTDDRPEPVARFPTVADDEFPTFYATTLRQLEPAEQTAVRSLYEATLRSATEFIDSTALDESTLAAWLHDRTRSYGTFDEIVTVLRATQCAALLAGYLLRVESARFVRGIAAAHRPMDLDEAQWQLLALHTDPHLAAACALSAIGLAPDEISSLPGSAVDVVNGTVHLNEPLDVPPPALRCLRAQALYRCGLGGGENDPFIIRHGRALKPRSIAAYLDRASRELSIPFRHRWKPHSAGSNWTHRAGLSVEPLR